ncbi:helix-turn-helix transcriptional regulator [Phenylobacterium deserti]|uniref:AraC family transcriptional regulator n=1 Tax=Phenylobacterium deserti TaxID=1914756 RepID=A0A328AET1_9CAUL|nr:AraC family transcriptional regulator [Phenylobacterium deserti]RAK52716.1 AraC family transcriptional regulator [Phenylobacterium deserti]
MLQLLEPTPTPPPGALTLVNAHGLAALLDAARSAVEQDRDAARDCIDRALTLLRHDRPAAADLGGLAKWQVDKVSRFVAANLGAPIRVTDLAALARLSANHFSRRFRVSFQEGPLAYVARKRVEFAQRLMLSTPMPLAALALEAGFCDQAHFTRVFKRTTGACPRAWLRGQSIAAPVAA